MLKGVKNTVNMGVGVAIYVDGQLKIGGHFRQILESVECVCV